MCSSEGTLFSSHVIPYALAPTQSDALGDAPWPESESRVIKASLNDGNLSATTARLKTQVHVTRSALIWAFILILV